MKTKNIFTYRIIAMLAVFLMLASACSKEEVSPRDYEEVNIAGVKVNDELFTPTYSGDVTQITLPAGRDLSNLRLQLLVINGEVLNFDENAMYDSRKPLNFSLKGKNGQQKDVILKIMSAPVLSSLIIEGLNIPQENIHFSASSLIVQVPENADLTRLKVALDFINGTLTDFTNGVEADYTSPKSFKLLGVDGETIYTYDFIITTQQIGPATVNAMTINGVATDSVVVVAPSTLIPYVKELTNFASADITLEAGFGNRVDPGFVSTGLNLLAGNVKVKVTGSDGIEKEFTIGTPQLSLKPVFSKKYSDFGFGANDLAGIAFSGNHIVIANYSAVAPTVVGPNYYDLTGKHVGVLDKTGVVIAHSLRKLASDDKGAFLVVPLGLTPNEQTVYKWNSVTATPVPFIKYSKASLGVDYDPRSAGINIAGSLDGNAIITIGMAQRTDVFVWTVTGGVLNPTPQRLAIPYTPSFYWSVEPLPMGNSGYVAALVGNSFRGIVALNNTMGELHHQPDMLVSDSKTIMHKGRIYLAYTAYSANRGAIMRIFDITDGQANSYKNPIFDVVMPASEPNANNTMDVDMAVIDGKLHAVFAMTNIGVRLYKLEN